MNFGAPEMLLVLVVIPAGAALLWWGVRRQRMLAWRFATPGLFALLTRGASPRGPIISAVALTLAVALIAIAAARPQWGFSEQQIISRGVDLIIAVDTSSSMLAKDFEPSRLERAKSLLQDILWQARGDRIGIIAFAGEALVKCPLTLDTRMASLALKHLDERSVGTRGTAIGSAINSAIHAFNTGSPGERVLVLLTDGEDHGSDYMAAAEAARDDDVKIYTIGIGSTEGMPIPLPDGTYKQDSGGKIVATSLDFDALVRIAQETGGKAIRANPSGSAELDVIMSDLEQMQTREQQDRVFKIYTERLHWFLIPAAILLAAEAVMSTGARRRRRKDLPEASA